MNGVAITHREVEDALKRIQRKTSPGTHDMTAIVVAEQNGIAKLVTLYNIIYDKGCFAEELNRSIFITLPKVTETVK